MKPKFLPGLALVWGVALFGCTCGRAAGAGASIQREFERLAQTNACFSLTVIIQNRSLRLSPWPQEMKVETNGSMIRYLGGTNALAAAQLQLLAQLRQWSRHHEDVVSLLKHPEPKVRTLALGALFQREDGRDLPLIASLINDSAPTFPNLHESMSQQGGPRPLAELENPQTVGVVAQAMLAFWGVPGNDRRVGLSFDDLGRAGITTNDFARFWQKYEGRNQAASWFRVRMKRATRQISPILPEYQPEVQRVLADMKRLPQPGRAWTEFYVLAPGDWFELDPDNLVAGDGELISMIKKLGPDPLLRFLQRQPVANDPDLPMDKDNPDFIRMSDFVLRHADQLLRPEDADALLACEHVEARSGGVNPAWAIGAALVQPARASGILHHALAQETRNYEAAAGMLAGALWRICGPAELDFLVHWFYQAAANNPAGNTAAFIWAVQAAARPDTPQLMAALVKDPGFETTDWGVLKELLETVNLSRPGPLVSPHDIYAAAPNSLPDRKSVLITWRNLLRREYGLPQEPVPNPAPQPKQVLTQPAFSLPLTGVCLQIVLSPDGKLMAAICEPPDTRGDGPVNIWEAATGKWVWKMPGVGSTQIGFQDAGHLIRLDVGEMPEVLTEWDLVARKQIRHTQFTGGPYNGVWDEAPAFDSTAHRLGFTGYQNCVCFDTASGGALWVKNGRGSGVGCVTALSPDGKLMASGGGSDSERIIKLFDAADGSLLREFAAHSGKVGALAFSADGHSLVTVTSEDGVRQWDVATGKLLREYDYPVGLMPGMPACRPACSPDGRWLAIPAAWTQTCLFKIGIFNAATGELQWEIRHPAKDMDIPPETLAFAPDGRTLYTGSTRLEAWPLPDP